ncbi:pentapeptide repeat-containing protein, partial [Mycobacterium tuberculosis]
MEADGQIDFSHATLRTTCIVGSSSFREAKFEGAHLRECSLRTVALSKASFAGARLENSDLSECDLSHADLSRIDARDSRFVRADLR